MSWTLAGRRRHGAQHPHHSAAARLVAVAVVGIAGVVVVFVAVLSIARGLPRGADRHRHPPIRRSCCAPAADTEMTSGLSRRRSRPDRRGRRRACGARPRRAARLAPSCSSSSTCRSGRPAPTPTCRCAACSRAAFAVRPRADDRRRPPLRARPQRDHRRPRGAARSSPVSSVGIDVRWGENAWTGRRHLRGRRRRRPSRRSGATRACCSPPTGAATRSSRCRAKLESRGLLRHVQGRADHRSAARRHGRPRDATTTPSSPRSLHSIITHHRLRHRRADGHRRRVRRAQHHVHGGRRAHARDRHAARARLRRERGRGVGAGRVAPPGAHRRARSAARSPISPSTAITTATMNWQSFSQVAFAFAVTPALLIQGIVSAAMMGLLGGLFPAIRAARLPIVTALREL